MKVINEFVRYQYRQYALSAKYVVPLIALFAVFGIMYSVTPIAVVSNFAVMSLVLFMFLLSFYNSKFIDSSMCNCKDMAWTLGR